MPLLLVLACAKQGNYLSFIYDILARVGFLLLPFFLFSLIAIIWTFFRACIGDLYCMKSAVLDHGVGDGL